MTIRFATLLLALSVSTAILCAEPAPSPTTPAVAPATGPATAPASAFKTEEERVGYAIGLQIGPKLKEVDFDYAAFAAGIRDSSTGAKSKMTDQEVADTMKALQIKMMGKQLAAQAANQKAGETYLAENAKKEGVKTTASGLQYKVIKAGAGKTPKAADTVAVNYKGTLITGKEFDASGEEPAIFTVNRVIPGWSEALQLMKEGDKWQLVIPSKLAYGEEGAGDDIGPNETLIFEVELVTVKANDDAHRTPAPPSTGPWVPVAPQ